MHRFSGVPWRAVLAAAALGLVARLAFGLLYWTDKPLTRDEQEYLSLARSLSAGHGFVYDDILRNGPIEPFGRAPGYPAFLAIVGGGAGHVSAVPVAVDVAQSVIGAVGILLIGVLTQRMAGPAASAAAAWLAALYPPLVWIAGYAMSEALFWPIGLTAAWLVDRAVDPRARALAPFAAGLVVGIGILVRPALVFFVPLAALALLVEREYGRRRLRRRGVNLCAAFALGLALVVGPWTVRNYLHHDRLMFVASEGGVTFWTGNHPLAVGDGDMAANPAIRLDNLRLRAAHPGVSEDALEPIFYREAIAWILAHPLDWIWLELRKMFYLVVPVGPSYTLHSSRYLWLSIASYLGVLVLAGMGLSRQRLVMGPGLPSLVGSAVVAALVFLPQERFRIPIIDPFLVMLAGVGLASWRSGHPPQVGSWAAPGSPLSR